MVIAERKYDMEINLKNIYGDMFPKGSDLSAGLSVHLEWMGPWAYLR